jgi:hypothetical protein
MKPWTKAVGWFWLTYSVYAGIAYLLGSGPVVAYGGRFVIGAHIDLVSLLVLAAAIALVSQSAWGWWVLSINAALTAVPIAFLTGGGEMRIVGDPVLVTVVFAVFALPIIATIWILGGNPPWKWRQSELNADG